MSFNLSEQIVGSYEAKHIWVKDVKEFIKRLKAELCEEILRHGNSASADRIPQQSIIEAIDELAGEKLI